VKTACCVTQCMYKTVQSCYLSLAHLMWYQSHTNTCIRTRRCNCHIAQLKRCRRYFKHVVDTHCRTHECWYRLRMTQCHSSHHYTWHSVIVHTTTWHSVIFHTTTHDTVSHFTPLHMTQCHSSHHYMTQYHSSHHYTRHSVIFHTTTRDTLSYFAWLRTICFCCLAVLAYSLRKCNAILFIGMYRIFDSYLLRCQIMVGIVYSYSTE